MSAWESFRQRTIQGAEALVASVRLVSSEPERLVALAAVDVAGIATLRGKRHTSAWARAVALLGMGAATLRPTTSNTLKAQVGVAVAGASVQQVCKALDPESAKTTGTLSTVTMNAGYSSALVRRGAFIHRLSMATTGGAVAAGSALALWRGPGVRGVTSLGGLSFAFTAGLANDPQLSHDGVHTAGISHGANLLFASEALSLVRATLMRGRSCLGARSVETAALYTAAIGHLLLIDGLMRR